MADQPENLVLVYLRRIDEKLDRVIDDLNGLKARTTAAEEAIVGLNRRLDRIDLRLDRIEKRFDLVDAQGGVKLEEQRLRRSARACAINRLSPLSCGRTASR